MLSKRATSFRVPFVIMLSLTSTVLTMTMSQAANAQQAVRIIRFENIGNNANHDTGVSSDTHHCVATGWAASWDINEDFTSANHVWTQVRNTITGSRWFVRVQFNNDGDNSESPDVDVVCFPTNTAVFEGNRFLYAPEF